MAKTPLEKAVERNAKYWDKRAIKRLADAEKQSEAYIARINKLYDQAQRNIQRDLDNIYANYSKATGMDVQALKTLLTKSETAKLWEELKRQGLDEYVKGNYKARISRLEKLQAQVYAKAKELYPKEQQAHTAHYKGVVNGSYYKTIYDTQMGTGLDFAFSKIDDNMMDALLNEKWSGKNYSQRIWGNTDILAESLSEILGGALMSGQSIAKTSRQIRERFDVAKYYADRLVRTETNHFNNEADAMAYDEMGMDQYVFMATLDTRTSDICQKMDGEVIPLKARQAGKNFPPLHPNCRSKTRAYMGEEIEKTLKRRARNPVTGKTEIVGNISYKEWAKQNGLELYSAEKGGDGLTKKGNTANIQNKPTFKQALAIKAEQVRAKKYADHVSFDGATNPQRLKTVNDTLGHLTAKHPTKKLDHIRLADLGKTNARANARGIEIDRSFINGNKKPTDWPKQVKANEVEIETLRKKWLKSSYQDRAGIETTIAELERDSKFKRWSVSSSGYGVRGTITHEYGHIISDQHIGLKNGRDAITSYDPANETKYSMLRDKVNATYKKAKSNGDIFNISKYADSNEREFFSEAFAMYDLGEELPKYITDMIAEVLNV